MDKLSDELIMALIDGELDNAAAVRVRALIDRSPDAQRRYRVFERTGRQIGEPYDVILDEKVPSHLINMIETAKLYEPKAARPASAGAGAFQRVADFFRMGEGLSWQHGLAYGMVLVCGIGAGALIGGRSATNDDRIAAVAAPIAAHPALAAVLESAASGVEVPVAGAADTRAIARVSFRMADGGFCREYKESGPDAAFDGVACRVRGKWNVVAHVPGKPLPPPGAIVPAGEATIVDAVVDGLIKGDVLSAEDEAKALESSWQPTSDGKSQ